MTKTNSFSIKTWAEDDRPREKLLLKGKSALSDSELIAIIIGSGSRDESAVQLSQRLLASVNNNINQLGKLTVSQLTKFKGIGEAKAVSIVATLELGQRRKLQETEKYISVTSSKIAFDLMQPIIGDLAHEEFWVLYLNNNAKLLYKTQLSKGGITGTVVDVRILFKIALEQNAISILLIHNHPSGKLTPSKQDIEITNQIKQAGKQLEISVLDHLIITENAYYSFNDDGKL